MSLTSSFARALDYYTPSHVPEQRRLAQLGLAAPGTPPEGPQGDRRATKVREAEVWGEAWAGNDFSTFWEVGKSRKSNLQEESLEPSDRAEPNPDALDRG